MLIYFLSETSAYDTAYALAKLDLTRYAEERAIVLGKMGKHREALHIYVNILESVEKAEAYCDTLCKQARRRARQTSSSDNTNNANNNNDDDYGDMDDDEYEQGVVATKRVYNQLLQIYLESELIEKRIDASTRLLNAHSAEIGTSETLELIPADVMKCQNLAPFFESMLNRLVRNRHDTQIKTRLMRSLQLQVHENKILCQDKKFVVNDEQMCRECNKRMGRSAMVRYPNGTLIHYGCLKNYETTYSKS